jgi:hypothetical protein
VNTYDAWLDHRAGAVMPEELQQRIGVRRVSTIRQVALARMIESLCLTIATVILMPTAVMGMVIPDPVRQDTTIFIALLQVLFGAFALIFSTVNIVQFWLRMSLRIARKKYRGDATPTRPTMGID